MYIRKGNPFKVQNEWKWAATNNNNNDDDNNNNNNYNQQLWKAYTT